MKIDPEDFRVPEGKKFHIEKWPTRIKPFYESKDDYQEHASATTSRGWMRSSSCFMPRTSTRCC